ncbi:RNA 2',3'-cyclic phosphodiesterase [Adhaeribacter radiodurans]|uniref:RNA 2',3'-cyclic phosphodiesterase n=1 Tax=Adhaeribacter radiodurans TaxID=2745197 RepID=A0A7L7LCF2_9BACT|nr:RNA 2',3'-cyclic phosphodiesterase [Adhaeribacter radiodurans]QMU30453.1 RNA 2',3'-cyclic phosphodiesterase [Adhaeribacter radiodurans]
MTETRRLFIAVPVPDNLQDFFNQQQSAFEHEAVRFVPAANLHLTVYFLGEVPTSHLENIMTALQQVASHTTPFHLELERLEPGPKPKSPRLIWARFATHPTFTQLCTAFTTQLGISSSNQANYIPHITLARFRKGTKPPLLSSVTVPPQQITLPVSSVALWESKLASPHPIYQSLILYPLTGPEGA